MTKYTVPSALYTCSAVCSYVHMLPWHSVCSLKDYDYIIYILKKLPEFVTRDENELRYCKFMLQVCIVPFYVLLIVCFKY